MTRNHSRRSLPRGFTLIEIMITLVVLGIVAATVTRLLVLQIRGFDQQNGRRFARSASQAAINIITSDLRMVQDTLGVAAIGTDGKSITVRVPYRFGIICYADPLGTKITAAMAPVDSAAGAMAKYAGWAFRNRANGAYVYPTVTSMTTPSTSTATCNGAIRPVTVGSSSSKAIDFTPSISGISASFPAVTLPTVGSPVFLYQRITYSFAPSTAFPGRTGLYRQVQGGTNEELIAPFEGASRFRYFFLMDDTSRTTVSAGDTTRVKGIDLVLVGQSPRKAFGSSSYTTSQSVTAVFFRNIRS